VYYLVYKPVGVVSTADDPQGRPTVVDIVPTDTRVYPVGRLDADSEGLIIVTNDGELTAVVTHPRYGILKVYMARVEGTPEAADLRRLTRGVDLDDGPARAERARLVDSFGAESLVEVTMAEGRNREVRRLFEAIGHPVIALVRTAIGPVRDRSLTAGRWRELTISEVRDLFAATGKARDP
jgi:23S rRNA pseudouridine2605 synthase